MAEKIIIIKKNLDINPGQPAGKGWKHHLKYTEAGSAIHSEPAGKGREKKPPRVLTLGSPCIVLLNLTLGGAI